MSRLDHLHSLDWALPGTICFIIFVEKNQASILA
jgi:hypothetical protein